MGWVQAQSLSAQSLSAHTHHIHNLHTSHTHTHIHPPTDYYTEVGTLR